MRGSDRERERSATGFDQDRRGEEVYCKMGQDEALKQENKCEVRGGKSPTWTKLKTV